MEGQMTIFDFLNTIQKPKTALTIGQKVYTVLRGEVTERVVEGTYKPEGRTVDYYWLTGTTTNDEELGTRTFTSKKEAEEKADDYLKNHLVMLSSNIGGKETHCYTIHRSADNKDLYAWYSIGYPQVGSEECTLFIHGFYTFQHAIIFETEKKARDYIKNVFMLENVKQYKAKECDLSHVDFDNLYPCKDGCDWAWAEASYTFVEDKPPVKYLAGVGIVERKDEE